LHSSEDNAIIYADANVYIYILIYIIKGVHTHDP